MAAMTSCNTDGAPRREAPYAQDFVSTPQQQRHPSQQRQWRQPQQMLEARPSGQPIINNNKKFGKPKCVGDDSCESDTASESIFVQVQKTETLDQKLWCDAIRRSGHCRGPGECRQVFRAGDAATSRTKEARNQAFRLNFHHGLCGRDSIALQGSRLAVEITVITISASQGCGMSGPRV